MIDVGREKREGDERRGCFYVVTGLFVGRACLIGTI
jgi:hypothetical protein